MKALFGSLFGILIMLFLVDWFEDKNYQRDRSELNMQHERHQTQLYEQEKTFDLQMQRESRLCQQDKARAVELAKIETRAEMQQQAAAKIKRALSEQQLQLNAEHEKERELLESKIKKTNREFKLMQEQRDELESRNDYLQFHQEMIIASQRRLIKHVQNVKTEQIFKQSKIAKDMDSHPVTLFAVVLLFAILLSGAIVRLRWSKNRKKWVL